MLGLCLHKRSLRWLTNTFALVVLAVSPASAQEIAIMDVTTIDPLSGEARRGQTVLIEDGIIQSIASGPPDLPPETTVVDGSGRYLIPGLWDMHVHLDLHTETDLVMLVVNGVLNVRDMGGDPFALADLKRRVASGEILGPTIRGAGAILEDRRWLTRARETFPELRHRLPVDNPEEARAMVALLDSWGVDLVKTRNVTDEATLRAIIAAAEEHGLTVAGHEPLVVEIDEAARLGMTTFEHVPFISLTMPGKDMGDERLRKLIQSLETNDAYVSPTLIASSMLGQSREERAAAIERPDERYQYLSESAKRAWIESLEGDVGPLPWAEMRANSIEMIRQMHDAGVLLLAGTDMGVPLTFPGFALHEELVRMVEVLGLSPIEALRTATVNPARVFDVDAGAIAQGMPADLLLLDDNPLSNISNTQTITAVVLRGRLINSAEIEQLLEHVRENRGREREENLYETLENECRTNVRIECLERLAGYQFSRFLYDEARKSYQKALAAGAGDMALEGLFSSTVNLLHEGKIDCASASETTGLILARNPDHDDKTVGVLDRFLAAATPRCPEESELYLARLASIDESDLNTEMRPIYREHYAAYLARVKGDEKAAFAYRVAMLPSDWRDQPRHLEEVAGWLLKHDIALDEARKLVQRATGLVSTPIERLQMMILEARIASAAGDHSGAVSLMEKVNEAVPDNRSVKQLLEKFRNLASESDR